MIKGEEKKRNGPWNELKNPSLCLCDRLIYQIYLFIDFDTVYQGVYLRHWLCMFSREMRKFV